MKKRQTLGIFFTTPIRFFFVLCVFLCGPLSLFAAVSISEIAWMGTTVDANDEWIELYNNSESALSLDGWRLRAEDATPDIALQGTIAPGEYFLLERTSDASVPSVVAGLIYTGALGNDGEVLVLTNANGVEVDRVEGAGWAIGGDNTTKATAQKTSNGSWLTSLPTPGRANAESGNAPVSSTTQTNSTVTASLTTTPRQSSQENTSPASLGKSVRETIPNKHPLLTLEIPEDVTLPVGVEKTFTAHVFDKNGKETLAGKVLWNFGDGTVEEGRVVKHAWRYAGVHRVTVSAEVNMFRTPLRAEDIFTADIMSARVFVSDASFEYIELTNTEPYDVDVSGWRLSAFKKSFLLPKKTILAAGTAVRIPRDVSDLPVVEKNTLALFYPSGAPVSLNEKVLVPPLLASQKNTTKVLAMSQTPTKEAFPEAEESRVASQYETSPDTPLRSMVSSESLVASPLLGKDTREESNTIFIWILLLLGLAGAGGTAMSIVRKDMRPLEVAGYHIIDVESEKGDN